MQSFCWDKHYETGIAEVDRQHQRLVEMINHLAKESTQVTLSEEENEVIIHELMDYAKYHFKEEEDLMVAKHVDARHYEMHTRAHAIFINKIMAIGFSKGIVNPHLASELLDFLIHWLAYHILVTDHNMAHQLEAIDQGMDPKEAYHKYESEVSRSVEPLLSALNNIFETLVSQNQALMRENEDLKKR